METRILKEMIEVVKAEQQRREGQLAAVDQQYEYDQWLFTDMPLLHELYLMILVTLRHQVERELIKIAARVGDHEISGQKYQANVEEERAQLRKKGGWERLGKKLKLYEPNGHDGSEYVEALRLLANSYKHGPTMEPDKKLLALLKLKGNLKYAPLPESDSLRQGLGSLVGLGVDAPFCDIAERFVDKASDYLQAVKRKVTLSPVKWAPVSLNPADFLH